MTTVDLRQAAPRAPFKQRLKAAIKARVRAEHRVAVRRLLARGKMLLDYGYDARRFIRSSTAGGRATDAERLAAHITMDYHRLEKGMAMPSPRHGFGRDVVMRLIRSVARYEAEFGADDVTAFARGALASYREFNRGKAAIPPEVEAFLGTEAPLPQCGGTDTLGRRELFAFDSDMAQRFLTSRRSVRQFTGEPVPRELIESAVRIAQRAPSVCNRQSARVFASNERAKMDRMLQFQNGNRGFGDRLGAVIVVASDMRAFTSLGERNQCWVDGGIFAMSLAHAFHSLHLGACMLNWSVEPGRDKALRRFLGIDDHYAVITMMGVGFAADPVVVAASPRRQTSTVVHFV